MMKKTLIASALGVALGLSSVGAQAAAITHLTLGDVDANGSIGGGFFFQPPFGAPANNFPDGVPGTAPNDLTFGPGGGHVEDCGGGPGSCSGVITFNAGAEQLPNTFTTGFNFGGGGDFAPSIQNATSTGNAAGDVDITTGLTFTALDLSGIYNGTTFFLAPETNSGNPWATGDDAYSSCGTAAAGAIICDSLSDNGDGTFNAIFRFSSLILPGDSSPNTTAFDGQLSRWRIEGCLSTTGTACEIGADPIPVPAAVWLFGSGLVGLVGVARRKRLAS